MNSYYPITEKTLYYVEFDRGGRPFEFTLFQRRNIRTQDEYEKLAVNMTETDKIFFSNEGHPYNMYTGTYGPDGCYPDQSWVMWMVDALNEKAKKS